MNLTRFIEFIINVINRNLAKIAITDSLIVNQPVSDVLNYARKFIDDAVTVQLTVQIFRVDVRYNWTVHNDDTSGIIFYIDIPVNLDPTLEFSTDGIKHFNILKFYSNLMQVDNLLITHTSFETNCHTKFLFGRESNYFFISVLPNQQITISVKAMNEFINWQGNTL
jgi:hypothetical protein